MTTSRDQAPDLFGTPEGEKSVEAPLAERLRPREFADFVGQEEITAPDRPLRRAIEADQLSSVIFGGPPGSGKTTLAHLVARHTKAQFVPFSAVTGGVPELRAIIKTAEQRQAINGQRTILFVDEIHRFNKAQQDAFLPHVERGTVILVGATTENPSFEVISPLLSRSLVIVPCDRVGEVECPPVTRCQATTDCLWQRRCSSAPDRAGFCGHTATGRA
ncbi:MAG: AAA family ATPase [Nitrospirae bacterium]|nr:AAA family ATPase [Nitrospirota bacterium]